MKKSTHLNYVALYQNVMGKPLVIGSGPVEGDSKIPVISPEGLKVYLNGEHDLSDFFDDDFQLDKIFLYGELIDPNAMIGMPSTSGTIKYGLGISNKFYLIFVRLKLDEESNGESEDAEDVLAIIKKSEIPQSFDYGDKTEYYIAREMLLCHFEFIFKHYDSYEQLLEEGWEINEELALVDFIHHYFELKKSLADKI